VLIRIEEEFGDWIRRGVEVAREVVKKEEEGRNRVL
jgi:hypothetical protein